MFDPAKHLIQLPKRTKDPATGQWTTTYQDYLEVKWRLVWFRERYPHGKIITRELVVDLDRGYARYKAIVEDGEGGVATGHGTEMKADFEDFCERSETRAVGRALAALGIGTQFVGQDLDELPHVADAPVASPHGQPEDQPPTNGQPEASPAVERITPETARELKKIAQAAFGYRDGEQRLRQDAGLDPVKPVTLRGLVAHMDVACATKLMAEYRQALRQMVEETDVPNHAPPQEDPDRAILRELGAAWGLPADEVEHVITRHRDPQKARDLLAQARDRRLTPGGREGTP